MINIKMSVCISIAFVLVLFSDSIRADLVLDSKFDDKFNEFDYPWYYYDDNYRVGANDRPQAAPHSVASVVNVPYTIHSRMFRGDTSDTHQVKTYKFSTDSIGVNHFATLPFTFGDAFTTPAGWDAVPFVGIGTNIAPSGKWVDLSGAEAIRFKIRARRDSLAISFNVQTFEIDSISSGNALFNSFDKEVKYSKVTSGTFWYAFDDIQYGGSSSIIDGATRSTPNGLYELKLLDGTGYSGMDKGAFLTYRIGESVKTTTDIDERGFVGIGCNLYDSSTATYWDAKTENVKNMYFQYNTTGEISYVALEVRDMLDVGDKNYPERKDSRGNGVVHFRRFPPTNGKWVTVNIPFDSLKIHQDWVNSAVEGLNTSKLAKIEWKVQGAEGATGNLAIDNVFFPCRVITYWSAYLDMYEHIKCVCYDAKDDSVGISHQTIKKKKDDPISVIRNGSSLKILNANYNRVRNIELMDCSGKRITTCSAYGDNITLPVNKLSSGMYFVRIDSKQKDVPYPRKQVPVLITK